MMEVDANTSTGSVMCELTDPEGEPLGAPLYLPQTAGPPQLQQLVNQFLNNEERLPYAFYISDLELVVQLGVYLEKNKVSVEKVLRIVYQPQAIFRIRPVSRCSATIAGHTEAVLSVAFSPDSQHLASRSADTTVRLWDLNTQTPLFTCTVPQEVDYRHFLGTCTMAVTCVKWGGDGWIYMGNTKLKASALGSEKAAGDWDRSQNFTT